MRNPEYQFMDLDAAALVEEMTAEYERVCGVSAAPGSPERLFIQWVSAILLQERAMLNYALNQNIPSRAEGEHLEALAELFFQQGRQAATAAGCTVRFSISQAQSGAVLIPGGTRVTDSGKTLYWQTEADAYIPAGETSVDLAVVCQTAGTAGNGWSAGQLNTIVDVYDYYSGCTNLNESEGGADEQTDEELYESMRMSMDALTTTGSRGSYIYHAKAVSADIADVAVLSPSAGEVRIYALKKGGEIAGSELKAQILAACSAEDVRPLTDHVVMADPEAVPYDITLTYYLPRESERSAAEIEAAVSAAIEEYASWQGAKLGRDLNPSYLIGLLMQAGVKRVALTAPAYTQLTGDPPQVAVVETVTVTNGGVEDG